MILYAIYDENDRVACEFEDLEEALEALRRFGDGEVRPYACASEGYYTEHYRLERGLRSCVYIGYSEFRFKEDAMIEPMSSDCMTQLVAHNPCEEAEELLETLDGERARTLFDSLSPPPIEWNRETRTIGVTFYYLETEETSDGDVALTFKCAPFVCEN